MDKVAGLGDVQFTNTKKVWCLESFTDISGIQKVIIGTNGEMIIFEITEEYNMINPKRYSPCKGFYNGMFYCRMFDKEYVLIDCSNTDFISFDLDDETVSFVGKINRSLAGYVGFQRINETICSIYEGDSRTIWFQRLDRNLEKVKRYSLEEVKLSNYEVPPKTPRDFIVGEVKIESTSNDNHHRNRNVCNCIQYYDKKKYLFHGGYTLGLIRLEGGLDQCKTEELVCLDSGRKFWCLSIATTESGEDFLVGGEENGTIRVYDLTTFEMIRIYPSVCGERIYRILCTSKYVIPVCYSSYFNIINFVDEEFKDKCFEKVNNWDGNTYTITWINGKTKDKMYFLTGGEKKIVRRWKSIGEVRRGEKFVDLDYKERSQFIIERFEEYLFLFWTVRFVDGISVKLPLLYL